MTARAKVNPFRRIIDSRAIRRRKGLIVAVASLAMVAWVTPLGLLLWARIRILTSIPKTAIADDTLAQAPKNDQPPELDPGLPGGEWTLRDPFQVDSAVFPKPVTQSPAGRGSTNTNPANEGTTQSVVTVEPAVSGETGETGETVESIEPQPYEAAKASAGTFRVQSAGNGLVSAVIDDKVRRVGETLTSTDGRAFKLVKVIDGGVVLEHAGREFIVRIPQPGSDAAPKQ
jgi:hypothetical protein